MRTNALRLLLVGMMLLVGWQVVQAQMAPDYRLGGVILDEPFDDPDAWETFQPGNGIDLRVDDGVYRIEVNDGGYIWGQNLQLHRNVEIEVETVQESSPLNNGYGLMCRAAPSNNGDGYYFLISGDGYYSIRKGTGDEVAALVDWTPSDLVNQGRASNRIKAVCVDDYLALYINGEFATETRDSDYSGGYAGMAAVAYESGESANIAFDNVLITEARTSPTEAFTIGDTLLTEVFEKADAWENYSSDTATLAVEGDAYRIQTGSRGWIWGQNTQSFTDVVVDIEAMQVGGELNNGFGVMCRAAEANTGAGYYFLISGDGYYAIMVASEDDSGMNYAFLVPWSRSTLVNDGIEAINDIRAVCASDYLALYVNGEFAAEARDSTLSSGVLGLAAAVYVEDAEATIRFDNLSVAEAQLGK